VTCSRMREREVSRAVVPLCLMLGYIWVPALAQESADPYAVCAEVADTGARLACYDHEAQRRRVAARGSSAAPVAPATLNTKPDDTIGLDGKQLMIKRKAAGVEPVVVKPFAAAITKLQSRPGHQYYFELDNGQVWESTDTEPELFLGPHETVLIRPGVLGAFFLKTQEGNSIRVHRLR
jgi:hypothetical protein